MSGRQGQAAPLRSPGPSPPGPSNQWKLELDSSTAKDELYGGCRSVECYKLLDQIGEGTYGQVYLAEDRQTGERVALKKIRMENEKEGFPITAIREIKLLKVLNHPNVIRLKEIVRSTEHASNQMKGSIYMVFDYMDHDLTGLLERRNYKLGLPQAKCYVMQLLEGLGYCHSQGTLHRDLKAANLLINNKGELKLADFGLARPYKDWSREETRFTTRVITLWYRPLELMLGKAAYGPEVDMWSVGCILAELLLGKALFTGKDEFDQCKKIIHLCGYPTNETWPGCEDSRLYNSVSRQMVGSKTLKQHLESQNLTKAAVDLLCNLLTLDPSKRLDAVQAYNHEFFWKETPGPCAPADLPKYDASHEMNMKRKRKGHDNPHPSQPAHPGQHGGQAHDHKRQRPYNSAYHTQAMQPHQPWGGNRSASRPMQNGAMQPAPGYHVQAYQGHPAAPPHITHRDSYMQAHQPYGQARGGYDPSYGYDGSDRHRQAPTGYAGYGGPAHGYQSYPPSGYSDGRVYGPGAQGGQGYAPHAPGHAAYVDPSQQAYARDSAAYGPSANHNYARGPPGHSQQRR